MDMKRINQIVNNDQKFDIFYDDRPVWIQELDYGNQTAKIGFVDNFEEKDVFDLSKPATYLSFCLADFPTNVS